MYSHSSVSLLHYKVQLEFDQSIFGLPPDGHSLATRRMYIATRQTLSATRWIHTATGWDKKYTELNWSGSG